MAAALPDLRAELAKLVGKPAWQISRTHGSMFFLEIGEKRTEKSKRRDGTTKEYTHGEWHFLIEMLHWRLRKGDEILAGSSDGKMRIDQVFSELALGKIDKASLVFASDLDIHFDSDITLQTFTDAAAGDWNKWTLYCPDDRCWSADLGGIRYSSIYEERP